MPDKKFDKRGNLIGSMINEVIAWKPPTDKPNDNGYPAHDLKAFHITKSPRPPRNIDTVKEIFHRVPLQKLAMIRSYLMEKQKTRHLDFPGLAVIQRAIETHPENEAAKKKKDK